MSEPTPSPKSAELLAKLEPKQQRFARFYVLSLNGADAARRAGYSSKTARQAASENLSKPDIREAIEALLAEQSMPKSEVLARLTAMARGDMADFLQITDTGAKLDLQGAREAGVLGLVKKLTEDKEGKITIELYDAQAALVKLGEAHGVFRDRIADNLDVIATAARSLDQKLMADLGPGPAGGVPAPADGPGEGGPAA